MKLYHRIKKRIAKKKIREDWNILNQARNLKAGDIIHTCKGWNDIILEIIPEYLKLKKVKIVIDICFRTESCTCSTIHCYILPIPTKDQIMEYWKGFVHNPDYGIGSDWYKNEGYGKQVNIVMDAVITGKCPFDEKGMIRKEYKVLTAYENPTNSEQIG